MSFFAARIDHVCLRRALATLLPVVGALVLISAFPASASERGYFGDLIISPGQTVSEVSTPVGNVVVNGQVRNGVETGVGNVTVNGRGVGGDVKIVSGDVRIRGPVGGDVECGIGRVYVNDTVGGTVNVGHGDIRLGPDASVDGAISTGSGRFDPHPKAEFDEIGMVGMPPAPDEAPHRGSGMLGYVVWMLATSGFVAVSVLLAVVLPRPLYSSARSLERAPGWSFLVGAVSFPSILVLAVVLAFSVVGIPILLLLTPAYLALVLFGAFVTTFFLGRKVLLATGRYRGGDVLAAVVGAVLLSLSYLIPFLGGLLLIVFALLGTGAAILAVFSRRPRPAFGSYEEYVRDRRNP